jgi:CubicO group peptidase (beta-lactamase class C family)
VTPTARPVSGPLAESIDRYMSDLVAARLFHGAVLVARGDAIIISKGYGEADTGVPAGALTRFRLASVTKQFTALGVLILVNQGKIGLDAPICEYLEGCPDTWRPVTVRHLLNHTSGIVDYTDFADFEPAEMHPATPQQLVARFRDFPLSFAPGAMFDYCNSNYVLLGLIIERASGQSYPDFMRAAIFEPLGMRDTGYDTSAGQVSGGAVGYTFFDQKSGFLDASTLYAAGGLYSTAEDLFHWKRALGTERLVPRALLDQMFTPVHMGYGFGFKIDSHNSWRRIGHAGNMTGVSNFVTFYPERDLIVVVLSNMQYADAIGINGYVANLALSAP